MRYRDICIEAVSYVLPERCVTSAAIERLLKPLYDRLGLPEGRLELMTGIAERRFWPPGTVPSEVSAAAGARALAQAGIRSEEVGCLLHCSVSRDFLEPATATAVHRLLKLPAQALNFDISNACLGVLTGMMMLANMIQLGQVETGVVVAGEHAEPLVEGTIAALNADTTLTRRTIKDQIASLTIGSAATAVVLRHARGSRAGHRLLGVAHLADTEQNHLCQGGSNAGMQDSLGRPIMVTNSQELLQRGVDVAARTWRACKKALRWTNRTPDVICTHQVGRSHRMTLFDRLGLDLQRDYSTFERLGNCGAASLPVTLAMAEEAGRVRTGDRVALLGIGSGINCAMFGVEW
ncbi:MAG: 3-oxoacyl-ACP synthase III [Lentisphaeria bacterium]|nr:3-oxoacyl-ACP synthase III [Lentisphaeria bacterium]